MNEYAICLSLQSDSLNVITSYSIHYTKLYELDEKPICVLSCNDGCIVALTTEAKAIGLHRGDPIFKMRDIVEHNNVKLFSTNMYLYAAMSKRVNNILRTAVPHTESYSIDESFLYLDGMEKLYNLEEYMRGA